MHARLRENNLERRHEHGSENRANRRERAGQLGRDEGTEIQVVILHVLLARYIFAK
jgi:hypothetical protein